MDIDFFKAATDVFLEVEVNPKAADKFEQKYQDLTGETPILGNGYQHQPNKWGLETRVYFNTQSDISDEFSAIGVYVEQSEKDRGYRDFWKYRTNDPNFFWALVRAGYRLGQY